MNDTLESIINYIRINHLTFGLSSPDDLKTIATPSESLPNGGKWLVVLVKKSSLETPSHLPFHITAQSFDGTSSVTTLELQVRTRNPDPVLYPNYHWDTAWKMRDQVIKTLANPENQGLIIPRYNWTVPNNPLEAGQIWFEFSPTSPSEDYKEAENDPHTKIVTLTYRVHWWNPTAVTVNYTPDPWLEVLSTWTQTKLGTGWSVYMNKPLVVDRPAVTWELGDASINKVNRNLTQITKEYTGTVTALTAEQRVLGCTEITHGLSQEGKILLDALNNKYITITEAKISPTTDNLLSGLIKVKLQQKVITPVTEGPVVTAVHHKAIL